jgi:glycosyltransferase involved in cell wall biosynthesis
MFSVIIPLYNKSAYIEKCLLSVLNQTFQDFEVIVVNDGSTDDSPEKVLNLIKEGSVLRAQGSEPGAERSEDRIKLINQPNEGVAAARNKGVKAARSGYIAFLDADDWWEPGFLEEMKRLIENYPEAGIYGSGYYLVKNGRKRIAPTGMEQSFDKGLINYFQVYAKTLCMPLTSISVVVKKSVFETEEGFKHSLKLGEDLDLWIRVVLKYPVAFLNKPLANYNQDVALTGRSVGNLYKPEEHVLWNLGYLEGEEKTNPDLKQLLDNLRVYSLFPYFLSEGYRKLTEPELRKVDWTKQSTKIMLRYRTPVFLLIIKDRFFFFGSNIKQFLIRMLKAAWFFI